MQLQRMMHVVAWMVFASVALLGGTGCSSYSTPGGPAEISQLADPTVAEALNAEPTAQFPARVAIVRVQESGYESHRDAGYGEGMYSVVFNSDVEREEHWERMADWPALAGVARLSSLMLPNHFEDERPLRVAAARLRADMLVLYTLDTRFEIEGTAEPVAALTLGLLPNKRAHVTTRASAIIVDTQTDYVYGIADADARTEQIANAWTSKEAVDQSRRRTEAEAFESLIDELEQTWQAVVAEHTQERAGD